MRRQPIPNWLHNAVKRASKRILNDLMNYFDESQTAINLRYHATPIIEKAILDEIYKGAGKASSEEEDEHRIT